MKKRLKSVLNFTLFFIIGLALLWLAFRKLDIQAVLTQIFEANYAWVFLSFFFGVISHFARALRWNILIDSLGYKTRPDTTFYAVMVGYLANMAVPRLGEVSRCGMLHKKDGIPMNSLLGSVVAERVFDFIVLLSLIIFVILFQIDLVGGFVNRLIFEPMADKFTNNAYSILYFLAIIFVIVVICFVLHRVFRSRLRELDIYQKIKTFLSGFKAGMKTIVKLKKRGLFFFYTFMIWLMYFLMTYTVFFAMDATSHLTVIDGLTILSIGSLGMVVPVPNGMGAYHFIVKALLFELYAVPGDIAGSWALLIHTSQSLMILIVGAFSYFMLISLKRKQNHEPKQA